MEEKQEKATVRCAGMITRLEIKYTKKDNRAFATFVLEDFTGSIEVIAWNETYEKCKAFIVDGAAVGIRARTEKDSRSDAMRLTAQEVKELPEAKSAKGGGRTKVKEVEAAPIEPLLLRLDAMRHAEADLDAIRGVLQTHPGDVPVHLKIRTRSGHEALLAVGDDFRVADTGELRAALGLWLAR